LKELLKRLEFVEVVGPDSKKSIRKVKQLLSDLSESVDFVNEFKKGRTKTKSFGKILDEL
jgi:hypothetical protein